MRLSSSIPCVIALAAMPLLSGCLAKTAANVVTAPVRVVSKGVDWTTTSQSEADRNRGRALRKREAQYGKLNGDYRQYSAQCQKGDQQACDQARTIYGQMEALRPSIPVEQY